jgi:hypothetical protein
MRSAPLTALERADRMDGQAGNRRELFLCKTRGLTQRFELRSK